MNKPVAWWTGKYEDEGEDFMFPDTRQAHIDHPQSETHTFFPIPLYTHPVKELTDEEIMDIKTLMEINYGCVPPLEFAWEILRKAQEK